MNHYLCLDHRRPLDQQIQNIPASVTSLDLGFNNLYAKPIAELVQALHAIPASVTRLDLRNNSLGAKPIAELVQALRAIPTSITRLDLGSNNLYAKPIAELVDILNSLPVTITTIRCDDDPRVACLVGEMRRAAHATVHTATPLAPVLTAIAMDYVSGPNNFWNEKNQPAAKEALEQQGTGLEQKTSAPTDLLLLPSVRLR